MHTPEQKKWNLACAEPGKRRSCTRQNEKSGIWRVRSRVRGGRAHARMRKVEFGVCGARVRGCHAHARMRKVEFGVCGARVRGCHAHARMRKVESGVCGARVRGS